jgi:hypothetical protein
VVPLQFHVACLMLGPAVSSSSVAMRKLSQLLESMSARTRRPVRFADSAAPGSRFGEGGVDSEPAATMGEA